MKRPEDIDPSSATEEDKERRVVKLQRRKLELVLEDEKHKLGLDHLPREVAERITYDHLLTLSVPNALLYIGVTRAWAGLAQYLLRNNDKLWRALWNRDHWDVRELRDGDDSLPAWISGNTRTPYRSYYAWCTYFRRRCTHALCDRYLDASRAFMRAAKGGQFHGSDHLWPLTTYYDPLRAELRCAPLMVEATADALPGVLPFCCWRPPYEGAAEVFVRVADVVRHTSRLIRLAESPLPNETFPGLEAERAVHTPNRDAVIIYGREDRAASLVRRPLLRDGIFSAFQCMRWMPERMLNADMLYQPAPGVSSQVPRGATADFINWLVPLVAPTPDEEAEAVQALMALGLDIMPRIHLRDTGERIWFMGSSICVGCAAPAVSIACENCGNGYCGESCHERSWMKHCEGCE